MITMLPSLVRQKLKADPRLARMLHGSASGIIGRGLGLLISLITVPITVRYLGKLEFGIWTTISTSIAMLSVLDLGIANTLTNLISEAYALNDREKAQQYYATAFWATIILAALLAPFSFLVWHSASWPVIFHLPSSEITRQARSAVGLCGIFFLISLPLNLANKILGGYQQIHLLNYFAMASSLVGIAALLAVVHFKGGLVALAAASWCTTLLGSFSLNVWLSWRLKPWIRPDPRKIRPALGRLLFGQGFLFLLLQLSGIVVFNSDNLVITHYLGAAEVTPYSIAWRLINYASLLQALLVPTLWPAFSEAYSKGDLLWVRKTFARVNRLSLQAVGIAAILLAIIGRPLIRIWAGSAAVPPLSILWLMAGFAFVSAATTNQAVLLTATGRLRMEAAAAVGAAFVNLLASLVLVQRIGAAGVIFSTLASFLLCMLLPQAWEVRRVLAGRYLSEKSNLHKTSELAFREP